MYVVKYTKAQYQAKIGELNRFNSRLETHLQQLEGFKDEMFQFWQDDNAQAVGEALTSEIKAVRNSMEQVQSYLGFYESCVEKLEGADADVLSTIGDAISLLSGKIL